MLHKHEGVSLFVRKFSIDNTVVVFVFFQFVVTTRQSFTQDKTYARHYFSCHESTMLFEEKSWGCICMIWGLLKTMQTADVCGQLCNIQMDFTCSVGSLFQWNPLLNASQVMHFTFMVSNFRETKLKVEEHAWTFMKVGIMGPMQWSSSWTTIMHSIPSSLNSSSPSFAGFWQAGPGMCWDQNSAQDSPPSSAEMVSSTRRHVPKRGHEWGA